MRPADENRDELHDLLPWHLNGTLPPDEDRAFRAHVEGCADCRADLERMQALRIELSEHGADLLADHPTPELLVALGREETGEADEQEVAAVRRHVELCDACASELRWISGEAVAGAPERAPSSRRVFAWAAAAAAAASFVTMLLVSRDQAPPPTGIVRQHYVVPTERADDVANVFALRPGEDAVHLVLEVDLPAGAFPVEVCVLGEGDRVVHRIPSVSRDDLPDGQYLTLRCSVRDCPPGSYSVEIVPSDRNVQPIRHRFALTAAR